VQLERDRALPGKQEEPSVHSVATAQHVVLGPAGRSSLSEVRTLCGSSVPVQGVGIRGHTSPQHWVTHQCWQTPHQLQIAHCSINRGKLERGVQSRLVPSGQSDQRRCLPRS